MTVTLPYFETQAFKDLQNQVCAVASSLGYRAIPWGGNVAVFEGKPKISGFWIFKSVKYWKVCTIWFINGARMADYQKGKLVLDYGDRLAECKSIADAISSALKMDVRLDSYDSSWDEWLGQDCKVYHVPYGGY